MKKVLLYFIAFVFIQLLVSLPFQLVAASEGRQMDASEIIIGSSLSNLVAVAVFALTKWYPFSLQYIKSGPWVTFYWTLLITIGMLIPSQFLEELIPEALTQDIAADIFKTAMASPWAFIALGVMAPIAEEMVFRGAIMRAAEHSKIGSYWQSDNGVKWGAVIFTALLFAAVHGNPAQMPHAFLIGILLGWLAYRTGSVLPGIFLHFINNSVAFLLYQFYPQSYDMPLIDFFGSSWLRLGGAILLSLLIFIPSLYQLNKHLSLQQKTQYAND